MTALDDIDDPRLTPNEREALERLTRSRRQGGEGWHRQSSSAIMVASILEAGETRDAADVDLLNAALRLQERAGLRRAP